MGETINELEGVREMRENWQSRKGFILAAAGAAIGLGNLWRFPFQA
jgi:NSS family neurotransmitter:Na+ symporter